MRKQWKLETRSWWDALSGSRWSDLSTWAAALERKAEENPVSEHPKNPLWSQDLGSEARLSLSDATPKVCSCKNPCRFGRGENENSREIGHLESWVYPTKGGIYSHSRSVFYQEGAQCLLTLRPVRRPGSPMGLIGCCHYDYLPCLFLVKLISFTRTNPLFPV